MKPFLVNQRQTLDPVINELIQSFIVSFEQSRAAQAALRAVQKDGLSGAIVAKLEEAVLESAALQRDAKAKLEEYCSRVETHKSMEALIRFCRDPAESKLTRSENIVLDGGKY